MAAWGLSDLGPQGQKGTNSEGWNSPAQGGTLIEDRPKPAQGAAPKAARNVGQWGPRRSTNPRRGTLCQRRAPPTAQRPEAARTEVPHRPRSCFHLPEPDRKCAARSLPFPRLGRKDGTRVALKAVAVRANLRESPWRHVLPLVTDSKWPGIADPGLAQPSDVWPFPGPLFWCITCCTHPFSLDSPHVCPCSVPLLSHLSLSTPLYLVTVSCVQSYTTYTSYICFFLLTLPSPVLQRFLTAGRFQAFKTMEAQRGECCG